MSQRAATTTEASFNLIILPEPSIFPSHPATQLVRKTKLLLIFVCPVKRRTIIVTSNPNQLDVSVISPLLLAAITLSSCLINIQFYGRQLKWTWPYIVPCCNYTSKIVDESVTATLGKCKRKKVIVKTLKNCAE